MKIRWLIAWSILFFLVLPCAHAQERLRNGFEVYDGIKAMDNPQTIEQVTHGFMVAGYLDGFLNGLVLMQDALHELVLPSKVVSEDERRKVLSQFGLRRLDIPKDGIAVGQLMMIYRKWAEANPKKLHGSARACIMESLIEAYGWK